MTDFLPEIPKSRLDSLAKSISSLTPDYNAASEIAKKVLALQRGLTGDRSLIQREYMSEQDYLLAYLSYYWPVSYAQAQLALRQLDMRPLITERTSPGPFRILDLGSGPGSMSCAAVDIVNGCLAGAGPADLTFDITLHDLSGTALGIAEQLLKNTITRQSPRISCLRGNLETDTLPDGEFDLILFGHSLNEIAHNRPDRIAVRTELIKKAMDTLSAQGFLVIIEPALSSTSRDLIEVRNNLCSLGYRIQAPCTSNTPCTILQTSASATCHDESSWKIPESVQKIADEAGLDRNSVKMAWFAFSRPLAHVQNIESVFRVVSDPMLNKAGRVRYLLCGNKNRLPFSAKKDDPAALEGGFFQIKRGDVISIENPESRESGLGWQAETRITQKERFNI